MAMDLIRTFYERKNANANPAASANPDANQDVNPENNEPIHPDYVKFTRTYKHPLAKSLYDMLWDRQVDLTFYTKAIRAICANYDHTNNTVNPLQSYIVSEKMATARDRAQILADDFVDEIAVRVSMKYFNRGNTNYIVNTLLSQEPVMLFMRTNTHHLSIIYELIARNNCRRVMIDGCVCVTDIDMGRVRDGVSVDVLASGVTLVHNAQLQREIASRMLLRCADRILLDDCEMWEKTYRTSQYRELRGLM